MESPPFNMDDLFDIVTRLNSSSLPEHVDKDASTTRKSATRLIRRLESLLFPSTHPWEESPGSVSMVKQIELLGTIIWDLTQQIHRTEISAGSPSHPSSKDSLRAAFNAAQTFAAQLPDIRRILQTDITAAYDGDPAATSFHEVAATYPGFYAIMVYRLAHQLYQQHIPVLPRLMTEIAHSQTGIDIHPGACIGTHFFIDHGTGVVIGETTLVGSHVTLYQGVTLGALNFPRDAQGKIIRGEKRHPTIEDFVVIYSGATILGGTTVIGSHSVIGGNVWLTESVPEYSRVLIHPNVSLRSKKPMHC
ncbi:MAG: serine acetyltransferase [Firmicutes bacterium]|nr:serine acetyltransferase [Bacillota bacterium]